MAVGRPLGEVSLDLVGRRQLQHVTAPRMHVAALGGRAADQRAAPVHPIAPESGRSRPVIGGHQTDGRRGSHVERDPGRDRCSPSRRCSPRRRRPPETTARCAAPASDRSTARAARAARRASASGKSRSDSNPAAASASVSQRSVSWSNRPVPEAIDTLVAVSPKSASSRCSPIEPQKATRADVGRTLAGQPPELGRPVRAVQMTAGSLVEGRVVEGPAQERGIGRAARVGPGEDRRDRPPGGVEAEQPVPEGRDADRPDVVGREARVIASRHVATASSSTVGSCSTPPSCVSVGA